MNEEVTQWIESFEHNKLHRREIEDLKRERTEFAAALITALQFLGDMRRGFAQLGGEENRHHWQNLDAAISVLQSQLADPAACLKEHDAAKDAEIRRLKSVAAKAGQKLLNHNSGSWSYAFEIADCLGYDGLSRLSDVNEFLSSVSIEESIKT